MNFCENQFRPTKFENVQSAVTKLKTMRLGVRVTLLAKLCELVRSIPRFVFTEIVRKDVHTFITVLEFHSSWLSFNKVLDCHRNLLRQACRERSADIGLRTF